MSETRADLWSEAEGWEYDLLRTLELDTAREVWERACDRGHLRMFITWRGLLIEIPLACFIMWTLLGGWVLGAWLGLGLLGKILLEGVIGHTILAPIIRRMIRFQLPTIMRPVVREELLKLAEAAVCAEHPLQCEQPESESHRCR